MESMLYRKRGTEHGHKHQHPQGATIIKWSQLSMKSRRQCTTCCRSSCHQSIMPPPACGVGPCCTDGSREERWRTAWFRRRRGAARHLPSISQVHCVHRWRCTDGALATTPAAARCSNNYSCNVRCTTSQAVQCTSSTSALPTGRDRAEEISHVGRRETAHLKVETTDCRIANLYHICTQN